MGTLYLWANVPYGLYETRFRHDLVFEISHTPLLDGRMGVMACHWREPQYKTVGVPFDVPYAEACIHIRSPWGDAVFDGMGALHQALSSGEFIVR